MPRSAVLTRQFGGVRTRRLPAAAIPVFALAFGLILLRALAYLLFEQLGFDSDQAINGLMAKHLSEGRAFPLFFYGQTYMLAVEPWVAVPFFWIAGPTVATLRASLLLWNGAFAALLIVALHRDARLSWWMAIVPALFFLAAPPSPARQLFEVNASVPPFVYIAALWFLRRRPLWFGVVLGIGFRNREFTMYAVPVLFVVDLVSGELTRARIREWLLAMVMFFAVSEAISALMPYADLAGPGTRGQLLGGFSGSTVDNLVNRLNWRPGELVTRIVTLVPGLLGWFSGAAQVETSFPLPAHDWLRWIAAAALALAVVRLAWVMVSDSDTAPGGWRARLATARASFARAALPFYVLGVGLVAVITFIVAKPTLMGYSRYALLGVLVPVGLSGALLTLDPDRIVRRTIAGIVVAWAIVATSDNVLLLVRTVRQPPPNPIRTLTDGLIARHIPAAAAGYWDAYVATFFADERVRIASTDFIRIQEYQNFLADHLAEARSLEHRPCPGGEPIDRWYLCRFQ